MDNNFLVSRTSTKAIGNLTWNTLKAEKEAQTAQTAKMTFKKASTKGRKQSPLNELPRFMTTSLENAKTSQATCSTKYSPTTIKTPAKKKLTKYKEGKKFLERQTKVKYEECSTKSKIKDSTSSVTLKNSSRPMTKREVLQWVASGRDRQEPRACSIA
jgi:Cu2+-containing amine oxidase